IAENTVPATMAITARRPGTRRISNENASIALSATPVWNSTSPISTKNGIGVSEKLVIDCTELRASCAQPGSPPRNSHAPTRLSTRNAKGPGRPRPITATRPPNSNRLPSTQVMRLAYRCCLDAAGALAGDEALEAEDEFDREQRKRNRQ